MFITAMCKVCHKKFVIDILDFHPDNAEQMLSHIKFSECPAGGFHHEVGSIADFCEVNHDHIFNNLKEANDFIKS